MKKDMGGAAHAIGLARLIMQHRLPVRLRVLIAAVEKAVSGNALRPGRPEGGEAMGLRAIFHYLRQTFPS